MSVAGIEMYEKPCGRNRKDPKKKIGRQKEKEKSFKVIRGSGKAFSSSFGPVMGK